MSQKLIKVKTPLTTNGVDPVMVDGRQSYTESILTESARATLEKRNTTLPQHLKVIIEDYTGGASVTAAADIKVPPAK
jgi:hypothetical protein